MKNVAIICGGFSSEFDISIKSAINIKNNFPDGYAPFLVTMNRDGWSVLHDNGKNSPFNPWEFSATINFETIEMDAALVYIHGDPGENGKIQAFLDIKGIPYVNSEPLPSQLSFDKWFCNQFIKGFGINVAESIFLSDLNELNIDQAISELGLPIFVKPCDSGSSYGIARVNEKETLKGAVVNAFNEGRTVVLESFLDGTEVTCGVYRNQDGIQTLPLTEIVSQREFFDFEAKYKGLSDEITPARVSEDIEKKVRDASERIYSLMQLKSVARIDFMLVGDEPYVIEVNTIPGFSNESIIPKMIKTAGKDVKSFWSEIFNTELPGNQ